MNSAELMKKIEEYGADISGISDRFMGNYELYASCLLEFINEPSIDSLRKSIASHKYDESFSSSHALKGLSGNLGLTPLYDAVCVLVESLREKKYDDADNDWKEVNRQYLLLRSIVTGEPEPVRAEIRSSTAAHGKSHGKLRITRVKKAGSHKRKSRSFVYIAVSVMLAAIITVTCMFIFLIKDYRRNTAEESSSHLSEINSSIALYIEEKARSDIKVARSIANSVLSGKLEKDEEIINYILRECEIWDVTDITIYTESGYAICAYGEVEANDVASEIIAKSKLLGEYQTIVESDILFVIPLETRQQYNGSNIVAISVLQNLDSFIDNMDISSFGGTAYIYLTQSDGTVVSRLSHKDAVSVYNILPLLKANAVKSVSNESKSVEDMLTSSSPAVYTMSSGSKTEYAVSTPIDIGSECMRLFYFVPVSAVNRTTDNFSHFVVLLSVIVILSFSAIAVVVFISLYLLRKKQFDEAILARENMLDLLVRNSKSSFTLLTPNQSKPQFSSSNMENITGERGYSLEKTAHGYKMKTGSGIETNAIKCINDQMKDWDGKSNFRSSFIQSAKSGIPTYFDVQLFPIKGGNYAAVAQDVTTLFEREAAAREALEMAEKANTAKSRFLSNMSHDIRTPMNAIVNMTNFAKESVGDPEKQMKYLNSLAESSEHLLRLVNDVLDMSRIESGQIIIASYPIDLCSELARIVDIIRPLCASKNQTLLTDFDRITASSVLGDQVKLSQILVNLLSNAVKFTPEGGEISFIAEDLPSICASIADVRFTVRDTGIGMEQHDIDHIFEPFTRANNEKVNKIEGTGLGLSICRSYISAMGGTIHCNSKPGEGSTFFVELFFTRADSEIKPYTSGYASVSDAKPFAGKRCLICEDNRMNRMIAEKLLQSIGFDTETASDGRKGADMFLKSPSGYYDVIYMDIQMPVLDGYGACAEIRGSYHPEAETVPIIAMTANVFAEDIEKSRIAGMNGHIGKPITAKILMDVTEKVMR